jgi:hypothetical protein
MEAPEVWPETLWEEMKASFFIIFVALWPVNFSKDMGKTSFAQGAGSQ